MESLLSIWNRRGKWYDLPHWFRTHENMKDEAESYAVSLATMGEQERVFVARGHIEGLHKLWAEIYAERYGDGANELRANSEKTNLHPATWSTRAAADYLKDYARRVDRHGRGVGLTALQYFAEYVAEALAAFGVDFCKRTPSELRENTFSGGITLPMELDTDRARAAFAEAIARGWMVEASNGYEWRGVDGRGGWGKWAQLAYFCGRVYGYKHGTNGNEGEHIHYQALEKLFSAKEMHKAMRQAFDRKRRQPWRRIIDAIIEALPVTTGA